MKRHHLEHIIRAIGAITQDNEFVIIGSQAILAKYPDAPADFLVIWLITDQAVKVKQSSDLNIKQIPFPFADDWLQY